jgi:Ala-tRNA(Pro) deacylase
MPVKKLREFLDSQNIKYITIDHSPAYTAREVASSALVPRREFAKTVIVKLDGRNAMAVVPASRHVDLGKLAAVAGAQEVAPCGPR